MNIQAMNIADPQPERQLDTKRKFVRRRFRFKFIMTSMLFVFCLILLAFSPAFNIRQIEVQGNSHYARDEIISSLDIDIGENGFKALAVGIPDIFTFRYRNAERAIKKNRTYIKDAKVGFVIPDKVKINIVERKAIGIINYSGINLLIDKEKYILDTTNKKEYLKLPYFKGLKFEQYEVGQALRIENIDSFDAIVGIMETIQASDKKDKDKVFDLIDYVDTGDLGKIYLSLDSRVMVNIGDLQDLEYKISFLKEIIIKKMDKGEKGFLDFTAGENPEFIPEI